MFLLYLLLITTTKTDYKYISTEESIVCSETELVLSKTDYNNASNDESIDCSETDYNNTSNDESIDCCDSETTRTDIEKIKGMPKKRQCFIFLALIVGIIMPFISCIVLLIVSYKNTHDEKYKNFYANLAIICFFCFICLYCGALLAGDLLTKKICSRVF
ncbi:hypothetical protein NGRA_1971 [Nosema granulosis]|uniref:Uncharacterized protein n=1 Tax=Nosema granulosis TaxID=83296 RepID=A0A9P6GZ10_9MICR|nr:hypothetical protein NGRA_1971 [Nosema granulosis]